MIFSGIFLSPRCGEGEGNKFSFFLGFYFFHLRRREASVLET